MLGGLFFSVVLGEVGDVFRVVEIFFAGICAKMDVSKVDNVVLIKEAVLSL